jgi:hypothetical protein
VKVPLLVTSGIMAIVDVHGVDPRDQTAELDNPAYRVYFWSGDRGSGAAMSCDEYEIAQADIHEVVAWADEHAAGRTYSLWACVPDRTTEPPGLMLVRLAGWDPTAADDMRPAHAVGVPDSASTGIV